MAEPRIFDIFRTSFVGSHWVGLCILPTRTLHRFIQLPQIIAFFDWIKIVWARPFTHVAARMPIIILILWAATFMWITNPLALLTQGFFSLCLLSGTFQSFLWPYDTCRKFLQRLEENTYDQNLFYLVHNTTPVEQHFYFNIWKTHESPGGYKPLVNLLWEIVWMGPFVEELSSRLLSIFLFNQTVPYLPVDLQGWFLIFVIVFDCTSFALMHNYYRVTADSPPHPLRDDAKKHENLFSDIFLFSVMIWSILIVARPEGYLRTWIVAGLAHALQNYMVWLIQWSVAKRVIDQTIQDKKSARAAITAYYERSWRPQGMPCFAAVRPFLHAVGYRRYGQSDKAKQRRHVRLQRMRWRKKQ